MCVSGFGTGITIITAFRTKQKRMCSNYRLNAQAQDKLCFIPLSLSLFLSLSVIYADISDETPSCLKFQVEPEFFTRKTK